MTRKQLDDALGADRYQYARDRDEITRGVGEARAGREFFPYLMVALEKVPCLGWLASIHIQRKGEAEA